MLQYPTKLAASSDSVHSFDGSLISVFNTEADPPTPTTYTNLETSIDLPIGDSDFIQQLLDNTSFTTPIPNIDLESELFKEFPNDQLPFDSLCDFDPTMTIQSLTDVSMEHTEQYSQNELPSTLSHVTSNDETTISSVSSQHSDESERDDVNRRKNKKGGGPIRKMARFGNKEVIKYSDEYHDRRVKNNEAVKKSRMKAKQKQKQSEVQMTKLAEENRILNDRVDVLMKELQLLRSLYKELKPDLPVESTNTH